MDKKGTQFRNETDKLEIKGKQKPQQEGLSNYSMKDSKVRDSKIIYVI